MYLDETADVEAAVTEYPECLQDSGGSRAGGAKQNRAPHSSSSGSTTARNASALNSRHI